MGGLCVVEWAWVGHRHADAQPSSLAVSPSRRLVRLVVRTLHACTPLAASTTLCPTAAPGGLNGGALGIWPALCGVQHSARLRMRDDASMPANQQPGFPSTMSGRVVAVAGHRSCCRGSLTPPNTAQGDMT
jgi:hypothetical protein